MTTANLLSHLFPAAADIPEAFRLPDPVEPVSYTHLTLPTNREV